MYSGFNDKKSSNVGDIKIKDLLQEILGGKSKISDKIARVMKIIAKIYCGVQSASPPYATVCAADCRVRKI